MKKKNQRKHLKKTEVDNLMKGLKVKPDFIFHSKERVGVRRHTIVAIIDDESMKIGYSACGPNDAFQRKMGVYIATTRALKKPCNNPLLLQRDKKELRVLFKDICNNFTQTYPKVVRPLRPNGKLRAI